MVQSRLPTLLFTEPARRTLILKEERLFKTRAVALGILKRADLDVTQLSAHGGTLTMPLMLTSRLFMNPGVPFLPPGPAAPHGAFPLEPRAPPSRPEPDLTTPARGQAQHASGPLCWDCALLPVPSSPSLHPLQGTDRYLMGSAQRGSPCGTMGARGRGPFCPGACFTPMGAFPSVLKASGPQTAVFTS